jgi:hypothetical protein
MWTWVGCVGCLLGLTGCEPAQPKRPDPASIPAPASVETEGTSREVTSPFDYLSAQGKALRTAERVTAMAEIQRAIQQFEAMEERWPAHLEELVQKRYLTQPPAPPAGWAFRYNPRTGELVLVPAQ